MSANIKSLSLEELSEWLRTHDQPSYRARQILQWIFQRGAESFEAMTNLSRELRAALGAEYTIERPRVARREISEDGTRKLLLAFADGAQVESVLIPAERSGDEPERRLTLCISSQVGCGMGCGFCATAALGLRRNLRAFEIVDQVLEAKREIGGKRPITNIVFMGMGEPLHNYDEVIGAIGILTADWGVGCSPRRITVSTVGLVPQMKQLLADTKVNLAVSISATTDEVRSRLMPVNRKYPLAELTAACRALPLPRRRRITFEYVMLRGLNDSIADARRLAKLLRGIPSKVNLIPFNPFPGISFISFAPTPRPEIEAFRGELLRHGVHATVRESRGQDIRAACGQLAAAEPLAA